MASARVVSVLLVCGVVSGRVREQEAEPGPSSEPLGAGGHYVRATTSTSFIPYNAPAALKSQQNSTSVLSRDDKKKKKQLPTLQRRIGYNQEEMYPLLIPVKFGVNPDLLYPEQRSRSSPLEGSRQAPNSPPRLIMDKDFNIRFDNPYIVPVSKPLAFVLDSSVAGRSMAGGLYGNKMMIPFPVLVQARSPMPSEEAEYGPYRGPEEYVEHRSNDDDEFYPGQSFGRHPPRKLSRNRKPWKNSTSLYKETTTGSKGVRTHDDPTEEEGFNESSDGPNVYPSKIFEDMYRNMPKYPADSEESRERDRERPNGNDDTRRKYSKSKEGSTSPIKEPAKQRQRTRPTSKYSYSRQPVFSATSDLEWVTHINSTTTKKPSKSELRVDVTTTTTDPLQPPEADLFHQPTTISPPEVEINKHYWREV